MNPAVLLLVPSLVSFGLGYLYRKRGKTYIPLKSLKGTVVKKNNPLLQEIERGIVFKNHVIPKVYRRSCFPLLPFEKMLKEIRDGVILKKNTNILKFKRE
jgi:hypothetical protein